MRQVEQLESTAASGEFDPALRALCDPSALSLEDAVELTQRLRRLDSRFALKLAATMGRGCPQRSTESCQRILAILERIDEGPRLRPYLAALCDHPNPRLRSKAVAMIARLNGGLGATINLARDTDSRVRANAIEALLGVKSPEARRVMQAHSGDGNHRVATTALAGLHLLGDPEAALRLQTMLSYGTELQRAAAAWAMGRTDDRVFLAVLQAALPGSTGVVRQNVMRSIVRLRNVESLDPVAF